MGLINLCQASKPDIGNATAWLTVGLTIPLTAKPGQVNATREVLVVGSFFGPIFQPHLIHSTGRSSGDRTGGSHTRLVCARVP
jgi:hypothetical protein